MTKEIKLSQLEKRLLYNFVMGENNQLEFPSINIIEASRDNLSVDIRIKPCQTNLNNFSGNKEKYGKALAVLIKKLQ